MDSLWKRKQKIVARIIMMIHLVYVPRLLELANDVEKNPGPPKVLKGGLIPSGVSSREKNKTAKMMMSDKTNGKGTPGPVVDDGLAPTPTTDFDGLRQVVERQAEVIRSQRTEIETLKKQMEKNLQISLDFQSEMSEIRKNWQNLCDPKKPEENIYSKLESLASAYNDIQDRLFEIDKSWKNNLMIYGVPCNENVEEDPVITEEKVKLFIASSLISMSYPDMSDAHS